MKGLLIILALTTLVSFTFIDRDCLVIEGNYYGSWASTTWEYHFKKDQSFSFKSNGHFGNTNSYGNYSIKDDTLILNSVHSDIGSQEGFYNFNNDKFLIEGDSCVISLGTGYDYCKTHIQETKIENSEDVYLMIKNSRKRIEK